MDEARKIIADAMLKDDPIFFDALTQQERLETADAILAALASANLKVLGREPTEAMLAAAGVVPSADQYDSWQEAEAAAWRAMFDAAQPQEGGAR